MLQGRNHVRGTVLSRNNQTVESQADSRSFKTRQILNQDSCAADVTEEQLQGKMLQRMRVLEEAGVRFTAKPVKSMSTMGGDGGFLHAKQTSGTILELVLDGFLHPKEARRCEFLLYQTKPPRPRCVSHSWHAEPSLKARGGT